MRRTRMPTTEAATALPSPEKMANCWLRILQSRPEREREREEDSVIERGEREGEREGLTFAIGFSGNGRPGLIGTVARHNSSLEKT